MGTYQGEVEMAIQWSLDFGVGAFHEFLAYTNFGLSTGRLARRGNAEGL